MLSIFPSNVAKSRSVKGDVYKQVTHRPRRTALAGVKSQAHLPGELGQHDPHFRVGTWCSGLLRM